MDTPPRIIEIEKEFTWFVKNKASGILVENYITSTQNILNADFFFPCNNIIGELKIINSNHLEKVSYYLLESFKKYGYNENEAIKLYKENKIPAEVSNKYVQKITRTFEESLSKANKQIKSTKNIIGNEETLGVVFLANNKNQAHSPKEMVIYIKRVLSKLDDNNIDAVLYFTPNVYFPYHENKGIYTINIPIYKNQNNRITGFTEGIINLWGNYIRKSDPCFLGGRFIYPDDTLLQRKPIALT